MHRVAAYALMSSISARRQQPVKAEESGFGTELISFGSVSYLFPFHFKSCAALQQCGTRAGEGRLSDPHCIMGLRGITGGFQLSLLKALRLWIGINYRDVSLASLTLTSYYWQERLCEHVCADESATVIKIYSIALSVYPSLSPSCVCVVVAVGKSNKIHNSRLTECRCLLCLREGKFGYRAVRVRCGSVSARYTGSSRFFVSEMNAK